MGGLPSDIKTGIASVPASLVAPIPTQIFLLSRDFNVFVDCSQMVPTVGVSHDHCAGSPMSKLTKRTIDAEGGYFRPDVRVWATMPKVMIVEDQAVA